MAVLRLGRAGRELDLRRRSLEVEYFRNGEHMFGTWDDCNADDMTGHVRSKRKRAWLRRCGALRLLAADTRLRSVKPFRSHREVIASPTSTQIKHIRALRPQLPIPPAVPVPALYLHDSLQD